jgi:hypothetical protein
VLLYSARREAKEHRRKGTHKSQYTARCCILLLLLEPSRRTRTSCFFLFVSRGEFQWKSLGEVGGDWWWLPSDPYPDSTSG